jgi:hypothetical protein
MNYTRRNIRLQIEVEPSSLEAVEEFRLRERIPTRLVAIRELILRAARADASN